MALRITVAPFQPRIPSLGPGEPCAGTSVVLHGTLQGNARVASSPTPGVSALLFGQGCATSGSCGRAVPLVSTPAAPPHEPPFCGICGVPDPAGAIERVDHARTRSGCMPARAVQRDLVTVACIDSPCLTYEDATERLIVRERSIEAHWTCKLPGPAGLGECSFRADGRSDAARLESA